MTADSKRVERVGGSIPLWLAVAGIAVPLSALLIVWNLVVATIAVLALFTYALSMNITGKTHFVEVRDPLLIRSFWWLFWFYQGSTLSFAVVLRDHLYLYSAIDAGISVGIGFVALLLWSLHTHLQRRLNHGAKLILLSLFVILISLILSPVINSDNLLPIWTTFVTLVSLYFAVIVTTRLSNNPTSLFMVMFRGFIPGVVLTILAVLLGGGLYPFGGRLGIQGVVGPNSIGELAGLALFATVAAPIGWRLRQRLVFSLILLPALALTLSKTSLIATIIAFGVWWCLSSGRAKLVRGVLFSTAIVTVGSVLGSKIVDYLTAYLGNPQVSDTLSGRVPLWALVLKKSAQHPIFGFGYDTFRDVFDPYIPKLGWDVEHIAHAHDAYLTVLLETGYLGLFVFLLVLFRVIFLLIKTVKGTHLAQTYERSAFQFAAGVTAYLFARSFTEGALAFRTDFLPLIALLLFLEDSLLQRRQPLPKGGT